jgi:hypothetical protein
MTISSPLSSSAGPNRCHKPPTRMSPMINQGIRRAICVTVSMANSPPPILFGLSLHCGRHGTFSSCSTRRSGTATSIVSTLRLPTSRAYFEPLVSLPRSYSQASFWPHLWSFKQAGHRNGNLRFDSELRLIFSVVRPVGITLFVLGHRIIISGILYYCHPCKLHKAANRGPASPMKCARGTGGG